jgi:hypothetical protein
MKQGNHAGWTSTVRRSAGFALRFFGCVVLLLVSSRIAVAQVTARTGGFVHRVGDHFEQDGHWYLVKGVNFKLRDDGWDMWANYEASKSRLDIELQKAHDLRANVIRIFLTVDDFGGIPAMWGRPAKPFYDSALTRLDDFLYRADAKGLKVLVTFYDGLNNMDQCRGKIGNPYSGAYAWENTSPDSNSNTWFEGPDIRPFRDHVDGVLTHTIPTTTRTFANDPRIFGWDVMNEPDHLYHPWAGCSGVFYTQAYVNRWIAWMARHIRIYDTNHPITAGTYGWFLNPNVRDRYPLAYSPSTIQEVWDNTDFVSIHWYQLNGPPNGDLSGALASTQGAGMPVVLEEIGQSDGGYDSCNTPHYWNESWVNGWTSEWAGIANNRGIAGALAWTNYNFNPDRGGSPGRLQCGQNPNPIGNGNYFGMYRTDDTLKTTGATFRKNALSPTCSRASFRTYDGVHYLTAQTSGSRWLAASGTSASHTPFTITPEAGGGYYFNLSSPQGYYVSADNGGGGGVHVDKTSLSPWESFGIVPLQRLGVNQWKVALHASNGQYVSAEQGGGDAVNANRNTVLEWETLVMTCE